jgi:glycosyltransferase involved in cell wall biosynthesis
MPNPPISCYIRAKNEERLIAEVISAALQVADEVVVIDSGSTDKTIPLSEAAGARVVPSRGSAAASRNDWANASKHGGCSISTAMKSSARLAEEIRALSLMAKSHPALSTPSNA